MAVMTPSNATGFDRTTYLATIEDPTFQKVMFIDSVDKYEGKILDTGTVRKYSRALGTVLAQNADGDGLDSANISGTAVTLTPAGRYIQIEWSANEEAQIDIDLSRGGKTVIERGLAETLDQAGLGVVTSLTQSKSQAALDATLWRQIVGLLMQNTNGEYGPGDFKAIFTPHQYPAIMAIDEYTMADARGDSENPNVKGIFLKGGGLNVRFSTVVTQDANGWHCPVYHPSAFIHGWNQNIKGFEEQTELLFRVNVFANDATSVQHDLRAVDARLTASQL